MINQTKISNAVTTIFYYGTINLPPPPPPFHKPKKGPVNLETGHSAHFTIAFYDSDGVITRPLSGGTIHLTFINTHNILQFDTVDLTQVGDFYRGLWDSSAAALGLVDWTATNNDDLSVAQSGQLRIVDYKGS